MNIPLDDLRSRLGELPRDRKIVCYCKVGQRGYMATRLLHERGFQAANLSRVFTTYQQTKAATAD